MLRWWKCDKFHKYKNVRNMIYPLNNKFTCIQSSFVKLLIGFFFSILYLYAASSSDITLNIIISKVHERKYDKYKNVSLMKLLTVFNIPCMKCNILTISNIIFFLSTLPSDRKMWFYCSFNLTYSQCLAFTKHWMHLRTYSTRAVIEGTHPEAPTFPRTLFSKQFIPF